MRKPTKYEVALFINCLILSVIVTGALLLLFFTRVAFFSVTTLLLLVLFVNGIFLIAEHLYTWRRIDWEIFGHEWYGLALVIISSLLFWRRCKK